MKKTKKSGSAIFMYWVIGVCLIVSIVCLGSYYLNYTHSNNILFVGITAFTILYHFWGRIIMGNVSKLFRNHLNYDQRFFKERKFEKKLYKFLRVKEWKGKALTYNPEAFSLKKHSLEEIANTMIKSEVDHWINEFISLSTLLFSLLWGKFWIFLVTAIIAMLFDAQFIVIQRYNRPRIMKILEKRDKQTMEEKKDWNNYNSIVN